jgi:hypothetical protein
VSISKPALKTPWASSGSGNMEDPGGINETGYTVTDKGPPRKWFNWILNKIETPLRYLLARGIPDYDPLESYSVGDRIQWGGALGMTFVCIVANVGTGDGANNPDQTPSNWARWARGLQTYSATAFYQPGDTVIAPSDGATYLCLLNNGPGWPAAHEPHVSPTYWKLWGHTDAAIVDLISLNDNVVVEWGTTGIGLSAGSISNVLDIRIGRSTIIRDLSFALDGIPSATGYVDITLSSPIAFATGIKNAQVTGVNVQMINSAVRALITSANVVRVYSVAAGGPTSMVYVRLLGY